MFNPGIQSRIPSEDLVGEALGTLQEKHGIKREDLFIQTKRVSLLY